MRPGEAKHVDLVAGLHGDEGEMPVGRRSHLDRAAPGRRNRPGDRVGRAALSGVDVENQERTTRGYEEDPAAVGEGHAARHFVAQVHGVRGSAAAAVSG